MKIALLGSRGIPARYSGFETFYEQLGVRLAERGHDVTVYNRAHAVPEAGRSYRGVRLVTLPCIRSKHLETITHTFLATLHALGQRYDVAYYCIVGNAPLVWLPRLAGAKVLLNVDGEDWARAKWSGFARRYQLACERLAGRVGAVVIADAQVIRDRYRERYGTATVFAPYGANVQRDERTAALAKWGLQPRRYILCVGRLVPENAADLLIRAYGRVRTDLPLVIVGDAPYSEGYKASLRRLAEGGRVVFTGYAFGEDYAQLSSHAYLYVQPSGVDGTRPALLDQLGFGNCVLVRGSAANVEVVAQHGATFDPHDLEPGLARSLQALVERPDTVAQFRRLAADRIERFYNWSWVTDFYEELFRRLRAGAAPEQYEEFLARTGRLAAPAGGGGA